MRFFHKLAEGVNVLPMMHVVMRNPQWWDEDMARTSFEGSPHVQANDIILRSCLTAGRSLAEAYVDLDAVDREVMAKIPGVKPLALDLMRMASGTRLGRVVIAKSEPGTEILPHADEGSYADYYSRYHVVLQGLPGSMFNCGDEQVNMLTGEIWWFDHRVEHSLKNNSRDDRVHLIVDVRTDD